jgi:hypothetical protein
MGPALLTLRWVVVLARLSSWNSGSFKRGQIGWPETSVQNYYSTLCNIPEELRSQYLQCILVKVSETRAREAPGKGQYNRGFYVSNINIYEAKCLTLDSVQVRVYVPPVLTCSILIFCPHSVFILYSSKRNNRSFANRLVFVMSKQCLTL